MKTFNQYIEATPSSTNTQQFDEVFTAIRQAREILGQFSKSHPQFETKLNEMMLSCAAMLNELRKMERAERGESENNPHQPLKPYKYGLSWDEKE